jgi:hypothetical protein
MIENGLGALSQMCPIKKSWVFPRKTLNVHVLNVASGVVNEQMLSRNSQ